MVQEEISGDYRWYDRESTPKRLKPVNQMNVTINSQEQTRQIPQIILEEQSSETKSSSTKFSNIKSSNTEHSDNKFTEQKLDNKTNNNSQKPKKLEPEKEELTITKSDITKSDIQDIKHLLEEIASQLKHVEGFKQYLYDEKSRKAIERGRAHIYKYRNYYDVTNTIKIAGPENPNDFDSVIYNKERIFEDLERYADIVNVANDGTDTLFTVISHSGRTNFSQEAPVFPGEVKTYYQVYELRLRSPEKGLPYRVTEYNLMDVSQTSSIPIEKAILQDVELPEEDKDWLEHDLTPTRSPTTFRIQVAVSIDGNFEAIIRREGNDQVVTFNVTSGPALIAHGLYEFELLVHKGDSINFRYSVDGGKIKILRVQEIDASTA